jgi:hypothetical protein
MRDGPVPRPSPPPRPPSRKRQPREPGDLTGWVFILCLIAVLIFAVVFALLHRGH